VQPVSPCVLTKGRLETQASPARRLVTSRSGEAWDRMSQEQREPRRGSVVPLRPPREGPARVLRLKGAGYFTVCTGSRARSRIPAGLFSAPSHKPRVFQAKEESVRPPATRSDAGDQWFPCARTLGSGNNEQASVSCRPASSLIDTRSSIGRSADSMAALSLGRSDRCSKRGVADARPLACG